MSIIERAVQEAQAKAEAETGTTVQAPNVNPELAEQSMTPAFNQEPRVEATQIAAAPRHVADSVKDPLSPTSRDLKAIVHIDFERLRAEGRLPSQALSTHIEDEIRRIKWPLLKAIEGGEGVKPARNNLVLVTSAMQGEGKTFTSLNLALSIVRDREMRVVLVDGDVAHPGLTPSLGLEERPGLNDALEDANRDISSVTYMTDVEGLYFVPAGTWNPHSPEFFAGTRMPQLMAALSQRVGRGVVVFDSPPLLATNEAQVATRFAGQVLIVVRADETEQQAVLNAIALVDKDVPVSAVLNRCKPSLLSSYYGQYYYGYGYGHSYSRGADGQRGARATGKGDA